VEVVFAMKRSAGGPLTAKRQASNRKHQSPDRLARLSRGSRGLVLAARNFAARIADFEVIDHQAADLAGGWRQEIDARERKILEWFAPAKQAAFKAHAAICKQENEALAPYREARRVVNAKLAAWRLAQEPGDGLAEPAGQPNVAADGKSGPAGSENESRVAGVSFRENWRAEVVDKLALVKAIAARPELVNLVDPNLNALNHLARAHKNALELPGVRVWCDLTVAASPHQ
jgi:hypothetical protein